jgi:hypothetical protein
MRDKKTKRPNATKHGVFAATAILPGEDPAEFKELYSELIAEWRPDGATEQDAVLSIAKAVWRKRRLQKFLTAQVQNHSVDPKHVWYDEKLGLISWHLAIRRDPENAFRVIESYLLPLRIDHFKQPKFARSEFPSTSEWADAILKETDSLFANICMDPPAELYAMYQSAEAYSGDLFNQELALDERLDAMVDRAFKRLMQIKAVKPMLGAASADQVAGQRKRIDSKKAEIADKVSQN